MTSHKTNGVEQSCTVAVLGAGSWGIAVARHLHSISHEVRLWEFDPAAAALLKEKRTLPNKLPGIELDKSIEVTNDLEFGVQNADAIMIVTPSTAVCSTSELLADVGANGALIATLAKGIDIQTGKRLSELITDKLPNSPVVALLGPSHAEEVARGVPTAIVAASPDMNASERIQAMFSNATMRVYTSDDLIGVELAAALKNIIAIAAGIADGLGYHSTDNMKGALLTRGLAEIARLGVKMGAKPETFAGLSGIGDLVTTCLSKHSRNRYVGEQIGRGRKLGEILASMTMVAEGVNTTKAALLLATRHDVEMPIAHAVGSVLFEERNPAEALADLMTRPLTSEN